MNNSLGFITLNVYALLIIAFIRIIFNSKQRLHNVEDNTYSIFLNITGLTTLSGIILGALVNSYQGEGEIILHIANKLYLVFLTLWILVLTFYTYYIARVKEGKDPNFKKTLFLIAIVNAVLISLLPIDVIISDKSAIAKGLSVYYTYSFIGLGFILQIIFLIMDHKNFKSKKYIPIYSLIAFGAFDLCVQMMLPELNYLINPSLVLIVLLMYHTIENPDVKMLKQMEMSKIQAEKANNAKSDFLSSMSHEIRTPLNAIVGLSEDIADYKDQVPPQVVEDTEDIRAASQTLLEIVGNILDLNKIESQKMEIQEEEYNPREEIETLAKIDATRIGDKPIDFKMNIAEDIPYELIGDKTHVKQILNNLLSNAFKYTEKGEVSLNVRCINQDSICNMMISVRDTGRGIKAENINKLFTKFERLGMDKNTTTEGTGLGLAITKSLVEMMGGRINVESRFGQGSIFVVNIPQKIKQLVDPLTDTQVIHLNEIEKAQDTSDYGQKKILIVDDNKLNIKVARKALQDFNFEIEECYDGYGCLEKVKLGNEYDLILMDIMMPNMSGETAMEKLKENPNFHIPTIALTADAIAGAKEKYLSEGFVDYIAKPFSKSQIKEKLDMVFKK